jgi:class 3 adenylate cyclase
VLLAVLVPLWAVCVVLHVKQLALGQLAWVSVYVAAPADRDGFPTVRGFWPGATRAAHGTLAVGDRLLTVGGADLRGVGPIGFVARTYEAAAERGDLRVPLTFESRGYGRRTTIHLVPVAFPWRMLPITFTVGVTGALVLARRPGTRVSRGFFLLAVAYGLHWTFFFGGSRLQTYAWVAVFCLASLVMLPLVLRAVLLFPAEVAPRDGRLPWWPWLFAVFGPISSSWIFGVPLRPSIGFRAVFVVNVVFIATVLTVLTRNFRRASPLGRRQLKWVVLGFYVGTVPVLLTDVVTAVVPSLWWLHEVAAIAEILIPLCVLMAIVRANYFDVDRLITAAAVYSFVSALLLAAVLTAVPQLAGIASAAAGLDAYSVQLALSTLVAAGMVPGGRWLWPRVERLLFRERYALRAGVEDLLRHLAAAGGPEELLSLAGERLDALVRPEVCVIYAPLGEQFAPVFARAAERHGGPPSLPVDAGVISALRAQTAPIHLKQWRPAPMLPYEECAVLERLRATVLVPVRRGTDLAAVICLGDKRSGDIYTATDLALLTAVADKLSAALVHFDTAVILRQEREMGEALRRYVPEAVAARLSRGQSIEGGERDVSVLFVDIRGYTTYSQQRAADTVFSVINRYTESVSAVIQRRGGTVVEFLGDGLMALFGAPDPCPDHARVAVQAACEVIDTVRDLALGASDDEPPIAVGVGIASGEAFVGNIQTSDRLVYTAVGDVVNLASRIQGLTRELQAAVAIDDRTHRTAGEPASRFERHEQVHIRGRAEPVDVYALPLSAA